MAREVVWLTEGRPDHTPAQLCELYPLARASYARWRNLIRLEKSMTLYFFTVRYRTARLSDLMDGLAPRTDSRAHEKVLARKWGGVHAMCRMHSNGGDRRVRYFALTLFTTVGGWTPLLEMVPPYKSFRRLPIKP